MSAQTRFDRAKALGGIENRIDSPLGKAIVNGDAMPNGQSSNLLCHETIGKLCSLRYSGVNMVTGRDFLRLDVWADRGKSGLLRVDGDLLHACGFVSSHTDIKHAIEAKLVLFELCHVAENFSIISDQYIRTISEQNHHGNPSEELADTLEALHELKTNGSVAIRAADHSRLILKI